MEEKNDNEIRTEQNKTIYVTKSSMPSFDEYTSKIKQIWDSKWMTNMGRLHKELEEKLLAYLDVKHISLLVNGHMSLEMTIQALGLTGEVITTPFTFVSTTHAMVRGGLTPVFCDINEDDYTIDVSKIENLITDKTSAIIPVHVYGNICNIEEIEKIAQRHNLKVLYDAAHTFGIRYKGKGVGTYGDASVFSFHATKVFNTIEGGAVTFQNPEIGKRLYNLKNFGIRSETEVPSVGANAKMNEFQAAMGICNLVHINEEIEKRKQVTEWYRQRLDNIEGIVLRKAQHNVEYNYSYFPVQFVPDLLGVNRDEIYEKLKEDDIYTRKYFYPITSRVQCYKKMFEEVKTPVAERVSTNILTLPLYADLKESQVERITKRILDQIR